jgi:hypothetical protein
MTYNLKNFLMDKETFDSFLSDPILTHVPGNFNVLFEAYCPTCGLRACYRSAKLKDNSYGYSCAEGHKWEEEDVA